MNSIISISTIARITDAHERRRKIYKRRRNPFVLRDFSFELKYRFNKQTIRRIVDIIEDDLVLNRRGGSVSPELQVLIALRCWGRREVRYVQ